MILHIILGFLAAFISVKGIFGLKELINIQKYTNVIIKHDVMKILDENKEKIIKAFSEGLYKKYFPKKLLTKYKTMKEDEEFVKKEELIITKSFNKYQDDVIKQNVFEIYIKVFQSIMKFDFSNFFDLSYLFLLHSIIHNNTNDYIDYENLNSIYNRVNKEIEEKQNA